MASSANDAPLSKEPVDRAIALLRAGHKCEKKWLIWSYSKDQDRYFRSEWICRDNEWTGRYLTEEELRQEIAQHPAAFRQMLTDAL